MLSQFKWEKHLNPRLFKKKLIRYIIYFPNIGAAKLFRNAETMLGPRHSVSRFIWLSCWYVVAPGFTIIIMVSIFVDYAPPEFTNGQAFPEWTQILGWALASISLIPLPLVAIIEIVKNRQDLRNVRLFLNRPTVCKVDFGRLNIIDLLVLSKKYLPMADALTSLTLDLPGRNLSGFCYVFIPSSWNSCVMHLFL